MKLKSYKGAGILLFRNQDGRFEILLGKRSVKHGYGKWAIPGGKMEIKDNTFYDCAVRELKEETGIDIHKINHSVIDSRSISVPYFHWSTFLVYVSSPLPMLVPSEFSELKWIPVEDVEKYDLWISLNKELHIIQKMEADNEKKQVLSKVW